MTVVLAGIGCDTTNAGRVAPLYPDERFEYIPIPEKTHETAETETYGTWELRGRDGVAGDLLTALTPDPAEGTTRRGDALREWPLHHDPNFRALTYGEHRPGYVRELRRLESGDAVGFYAGLRRPDGERAHRYLIGWFTVASVEVIPVEASEAEAAAVFDRHPKNAHAKRASAGERYYDDEAVAIVDGREPGGLFDRAPIRMSEYAVAPGNERPQYYLDSDFAERFSVAAGRENMQFKPAYRCEMSVEAFRRAIEAARAAGNGAT